jgi:hypothetical protein
LNNQLTFTFINPKALELLTDPKIPAPSPSARRCPISPPLP